MKINKIGQVGRTESEITVLLRENPNMDLSQCECINPQKYNAAIDSLYLNLKKLVEWQDVSDDVAQQFHLATRDQWLMPQKYQDLDIVQYLLDLCADENELQRVGHELLLYQKHNLFNLLRYLKYLVDVLKKHQIVLGVGRGSSVASFILYKLGVHKVNSLYYGLSVEEFLR